MEPFLNINLHHMQQFNNDMYLQLVNYPQEVIACMDEVVNQLFFTKYPSCELSHQIEVRPYNADKTKSMRLLNPEGKSLMPCLISVSVLIQLGFSIDSFN